MRAIILTVHTKTVGFLARINYKKVAQTSDLAHQDHTSIHRYNDENSLSCDNSFVILRYDGYLHGTQITNGRKRICGYALCSQKEVERPALLVEPKYDKTAKKSIDHKERRTMVDSSETMQEKLCL